MKLKNKYNRNLTAMLEQFNLRSGHKTSHREMPDDGLI